MNNRLFNNSLLSPIPGAVAFFVLGLLLGEFTIGYIGNDWPLFLAKLVIGLAVAAIYYTACIQPATKVEHRGVVYFLKKRFRTGPDKKGFLEGLNATWLPKGIMTVQDEDVREKTMALGKVEEYSEDEVVVTNDVSVQWVVVDPYNTQSVEKLEDSARAVFLQAVRDEIIDHPSLSTPAVAATATSPVVDEKVGIIKQDKKDLSDRITKRIDKVLTENLTDPKRNTKLTIEMIRAVNVQVKETRLPKPMEEALTQRTTELVERAAEERNAVSRQQQVEILSKTPDGKPSGIDRQMAYLGSLADAGKEGVKLNHLSVSPAITESVAGLAAGIERGLKSLADSRTTTPPAPPAGGTTT